MPDRDTEREGLRERIVEIIADEDAGGKAGTWMDDAADRILTLLDGAAPAERSWAERVDDALRVIANAPVEREDVEDVIAGLRERIAALQSLTAAPTGEAARLAERLEVARGRLREVDGAGAPRMDPGTLAVYLYGLDDLLDTAARLLRSLDAGEPHTREER